MREIPRKRRSRGRLPKTTVRTDQQDRDEDKGFRTMLEEIRGSSKSQRRQSAEKDLLPPESRCSSENEPRRSRTHVVSQHPNERYRASLGSFGDSNRQVSGGSTSKDSYSGKKEAMFERYGSDHVEPPTVQKNITRPERLGNPSPGEGLRNALGNLENRLHRKQTDRRTDLNPDKRVNKCQKSSSEKGFATLVEELVDPRRSQKGIPLRPALLMKQRTRSPPTSAEVRLTFSVDCSLFCPLSINVSSPSPANDKKDMYLHYLGRPTPAHTLPYFQLDNRSPCTSQSIPPL
jgi:hypothetical protein